MTISNTRIAKLELIRPVLVALWSCGRVANQPNPIPMQGELRS
jgi:hypothetical protein